jgi:hypothetical protein
MADKKITALTATTSVVGADLFPIVTDTTGTPTTKKITATNLAAFMTGVLALGATTLDGLTDVVLTSPSSGQILSFDGVNFVNAAAAASYNPVEASVFS